MPSTKRSWRKQNGDKRFLKMLRRNPRAIKTTYLVEEDMELGSQPGSVEVAQVDEFTDSPSARVRGWTLSLGWVVCSTGINKQRITTALREYMYLGRLMTKPAPKILLVFFKICTLHALGKQNKFDIGKCSSSPSFKWWYLFDDTPRADVKNW